VDSSRVIRAQKRVNLPVQPGSQVVALTVELLAARCAGTFGKGFLLRAVGRRLYVQMAERRVPLYLDYDADPVDVQERALALLRFRHGRSGGFESEAWRDLIGHRRVRTGKPGRSAKGGSKARPDLDEVVALWQRFKRAQGVSDATIERHYLSHLRRLDPDDPLGDESLLGAIERTDPRSPGRRRVVAFLRRLCGLCGQPWNGELLDPLQNAGMAAQHRPQAFFSDEQIEAIVQGGLSASWRRVVVLLAVYGLRPWEAWVAEPCRRREDCVWVSAGKTNRHGTTPPRQVPPFHPSWFSEFRVVQLWKAPLPTLGTLSQAGARVNQQLRRKGLIERQGGTSYGFRHAYARRLHSPLYRVTDAHAALFMGHTVAAHHKAYRSWLGDEDPVGVYLDRPG